MSNDNDAEWIECALVAHALYPDAWAVEAVFYPEGDISQADFYGHMARSTAERYAVALYGGFDLFQPEGSTPPRPRTRLTVIK